MNKNAQCFFKQKMLILKALKLCKNFEAFCDNEIKSFYFISFQSRIIILTSLYLCDNSIKIFLNKLSC